MQVKNKLYAIALFLSIGLVDSSGCAQENTQSWDPFAQQLQIEDARRFARLFTEQHGKLSAEQLQVGYLDGASRGVQIFTPQRIVNSAHMAKSINELNDDYAYAIETCLPMVDELNDEMRSIYLAMHGLLPRRNLPKVYLVFGAGNSGGTAAADAQVIGLEVACKKGKSAEAFKRYMRMMFAHETVHTFQDENENDWLHDPLLVTAISEGTADYLASLVLGHIPDPERDAWAKAKGEELWKQFAHDRELVQRDGKNAMESGTETHKSFSRWFANYGNAPDGWPYEVGYWIGRQIVTQYVMRSPDKIAAIDRLLSLHDPEGILRDSGVVLPD